MSVDATKLVIPGHGTVFTAPVNTAPPTDPLNAFSLLANTVDTNWSNLGHTSKQNTIAFTKEGGEKESLDTFLADGVRTTTGSTTWGVTANSLQFDTNNLLLAFNGEWDSTTGGYKVATPEPVQRAVFLYFADTTGQLGFWLPNTEVSLGDAPSVDVANFFELPLSISILAADTSIIAAVGDRAVLYEIFKTGAGPESDAWTATLSGTPTGGTFRLGVNGQRTADIAYNANGTAVQAALNLLPGVSATVTGTSSPFSIALATAAHMWATSALTGGTTPKMTVAIDTD